MHLFFLSLVLFSVAYQSTTENLQIKEKYKLEMGFLHCGICKSIF